jgi:CRISPR system Cascade subunit CasD
VSFDPAHRQYTWRSVVRGHVEVPNPSWTAPGPPDPPTEHDPMALLGG